MIEVWSEGDLIVEQIANCLVKRGYIRTVEHHGQVIAVAPVGLAVELLLHHVVETRPGQRVRDRDTDVIWLFGANEIPRQEDVLPAFSEIAELDEPTSSDAALFEGLGGGSHVLDLGSLVHGVEDPL